jgi:hypothetical protein
MAQFMVLPGAAELVEAFASIPPGALRDSIVHHAQALAAQYDGGPAPGWSNVRPARIGSTPAAPAAPRLSSPFAEDLTAKSPEGQIVERALRGESDHSIAADMGVKLGTVVAVKRKARAEGGVSFPGDDLAKPKAAKAKRQGANLLLRMPLPEPPWWWEDDEHPNWETPVALPHAVEGARSRALIGPMDRRSYATMTRAAANWKMTLREYVQRRLHIVRRIEAGETPMQIAVSLGMQGTAVYSLLAAIGQPRMEGVNSGAQTPHAYKTAARLPPDPPPAPAATPAPVATTPPPEPTPTTVPDPEPRQAALGVVLPAWPPTPATKGAHAAKLAAVTKWGFATEADYDGARVRVRDLATRGWKVPQIAEAIGQPRDFVKNADDYWRRLQAQLQRGAQAA